MGMTVVDIGGIRLAQGSINKELLVCPWRKIYSKVHETGNIRRHGGGRGGVCMYNATMGECEKV